MLAVFRCTAQAIVACALLFGLLLLNAPAAAQDANVQGIVLDGTGESLPGVNITLMGTQRGTVSRADGSFSLYVPFDEIERPRLRFSFIGFQAVEQPLNGPVSNLEVVMNEAVARGEEVIVSASRVDERILEVPVTVGRLSGRDLTMRPSIDLVASMESMAGVDVSRSSMLVNSPSTRGFNSTKSERVIQLTDYVDFVAPSLSVYSGNTSGPPLVDMESMDLIHGASSALYGPNAFNGVIIMNSRDPINDQGVDLRLKGGTRDLVDVSGRIAQGFFDDRVAIKLVGRYMEANEYISRNFNAQAQEIVPSNNPVNDPRGYDAVNRYGAINLSNTEAANVLQSSGIDPSSNNIFLPGYSEEALVGRDMNASTWQISPTVSAQLGDDIRATYWYRFSSSEGIYQSNSRFRWDGITVSTNALELEGNNWVMRGYRTADSGGDSYDINLLGAVMNQQLYVQGPDPTSTEVLVASQLPDDVSYAGAYAAVYGTAYEQAMNGGATAQEAFEQAQAAAGSVLPQAGEDRFDAARSATLNLPVRETRPTFDIESALYHAEGQYTFESDVVDATVGGNYRQYRLTSAGTLFSDGEVASPINPDGTRDVRDGIDNDEYGGFLRLQRGFFNDRLSLSAVGRVDAFRNFDTQFSPRLSGVLTLGENRQHNFRVNYASAFRPPAQLDQYIYLDLGTALLRGNAGDGYFAVNPPSRDPEGRSVAEQVQQEALFQVDPLDVEEMESIEVGYKTNAGALFADVSYYRSEYTGFIGTRQFIGKEDGSRITENDLQRNDDDPLRPRLIQVWTNADQDITTQGAQLGLEYRFADAFRMRGNYTWSHIDNDNLGDAVGLGFNTPEHKLNVGVEGEIGNFTYHTNLRWHDEYTFQMPFARGPIDSNAVLDGQIGYSIPALRTTVSVGGTNLTDTDYVTAYGAAPIGRIVYTSLSISY
ncbi:hypothetical protein CRI93_08700 [Longimonas halophila]|uniref:TonB-dependent receptor plug domain-containing protein n=1 Tax=Longimonas halophila TaxID=1469170 RepID=A0A2H3NL09_9BACT|nr:TonB-dependent receptor [Longimonas halophila]PEN06708.1 hypothetical protein CRI93_08700 [Longimonas halophila]